MRYTYGMTSAAVLASEDIRDIIAGNLRAELTRQRWSNRKAAAALGLTHVYVGRRANGEVELSGTDLALFAGLLEIPVAKLFEGTTKTPAATNGDGGQVGPAGLDPATSTVESGRFGQTEAVEQDAPAVVLPFVKRSA